ncbi:hypothetical protein Vi05172_g9997 [Venturia inaequalis]|nr:hypothetical protein Vi05172_g9997 [Venturia inaequalis]
MFTSMSRREANKRAYMGTLKRVDRAEQENPTVQNYTFRRASNEP